MIIFVKVIYLILLLVFPKNTNLEEINEKIKIKSFMILVLKREIMKLEIFLKTQKNY